MVYAGGMSIHSAHLSRRRFLSASGAAAAGVALSPWVTSARETGGGWLKRSLKAGMIDLPGVDDWTGRLEAAVAAGFVGVEPKTREDLDAATVRKAADAAGIVIDGTHGGYHWKVRHTDPDPDVRQEAARLIAHSINQTADLGGETFLLVPGHGKDGDKATVLERATAAVTGALPLAERRGVTIVIENVWNEMFYDPDGGSDQTADELAAFVDSFASDRVAVQFDIGNHWRYGDPAGWVRTLGSRIAKLDIKGYSRAASRFTDIGEGDIDWASVRAALAGIGFTGWLAAEVGGGDADRLRTIAGQMNQTMHCDQTLEQVRVNLNSD